VEGAVIGLLCRTSDRDARGAQGAEALANELAGRIGATARMIGSPGQPKDGHWEDDLRESRGCLLEAGGQLEDAMTGGRYPVLTASDGSICMTTLPVLARQRPDAWVLWLDAHGDFNTPDSTPSGFLGGMCLAAACGRWDAGWPATIDPAMVSFLGVRDLDPGERVEVEQARVGTGVPGDGPIFVHLDLDVLDPSVLAPQFPVPGGLQAADVRDVLARLRDEGRLVGLEVTALEDPAGVELVTEILEPVTR
jgi:arginase